VNSRRFHFDRGTPREQALRAIASALSDEGLLLLATAQGGRIVSVRDREFDVYVVPASLIIPATDKG
jgi:hypothetical protein